MASALGSLFVNPVSFIELRIFIPNKIEIAITNKIGNKKNISLNVPFLFCMLNCIKVSFLLLRNQMLPFLWFSKYLNFDVKIIRISLALPSFFTCQPEIFL